MQSGQPSEAELAAIQQTLEAACVVFQKSPNQATESLKEFRNIALVIPACQFVLERSTMPLAQFEAIGALRDAIIARWDTLSAQQIGAIRNYLLTYATSRLSLPYHVQSHLVHAIAVITKRGWLNSVDLQDSPTSLEIKSSLLAQISQLIVSTDLSLKYLGMMLATALIEEMESSSKSTRMSLPWEYHLRCYQDFETRELKQLFSMAFQMMKSLLDSTPMATIMGAENAKQYFERCLAFLTTIVNWPFNQGSAIILGLQMNTRSANSVTPGPEWRDVFVDRPDLLQIYIRVFDSVRSNERYANRIQQGLTTLFSLYGDVFANENQRIQYMSILVHALLHLLQLMSGGLASMDEMYQMANLIHRFVSSFPIDFLLHLGAPLLRHLMTSVCNFTEQCIKLLKVDEYDNSCMEVLDLLLECWSLLVQSKENGAEFVAEYGLKVFVQYLDARLALAKQELTEYDDPDHNTEEALKDNIQYADQLALVAQIGRVAPLQALRTLHTVLARVFTAVQHYASQGPTASGQLMLALEELHWLILVCGFFLCDSPEGETILAPALLMGHMEIPPGAPDPVAVVVNQILDVAKFENSLLLARQHGQFWSPLMAETVAWFIQRWVHSYLLLDESQFIRPGLLDLYSRDSPTSLHLIDFLIEKCAINLTMWGGDSGVMHETCNILQALATRRIQTSSIMTLTSWREFLGGWTSGVQALRELPAVIQGILVKALARLGLGITEDDKAQYLKAIIRPIEQSLAGYLNRPDFMQVCKQAKVVGDIVVVLECFRGYIKATTMQSYKYIYAVCMQYMGAFVELLKLYKDYPAIVELILDICHDFAQYQLDFLPEAESGVLLESVVSLIQAYDGCGLGKRATGQSAHAKAREVEQSKEILSLLYTLRVIADQSHPGVVRVVFGGLSTILPMLVQELLEFPEVRHTYFQVVSGLLHRHVQHTPQMPEALFTAVMASFEYGISRSEPQIQRETLDSIYDLATYNFTSQQSRTNMLSAGQREQLARLVKAILNFLLFGSQFSLDLIEQASDAFLALICSERETYMSMVQLLLSEQEQTIQSRLSVAFNELMAQIDISLERNNRTRFREKMRMFLSSSRSILGKK